MLHHHHVVGQGPHHPQVMGDEKVGHPVLTLELAEQGDDLGLDRHVEGRSRFVEDQQLRPEDDGPGDGDPLALTAGELVGVAMGHLRLQFDIGQGRGDEPEPFFPVAAEVVDLQPLLNDLLDGQAGRQR